MKKYGTLLILVLIPLSGIMAQTPMMRAWQHLLNKRELAAYFAGSFEKLGIIVDSANEAFTVVHAIDHFTLEEGVDSAKVDYVVRLRPENIRNMKKHGADNVIDAMESYRIMSVLFTPLTQSGLNHPNMTNRSLLRAVGVEKHLHVYLMSPDKKEYTAHTIVFVNRQWLLIPGIHGKAARTFVMMPDDAVAYQKHLFAAQKSNTRQSWRAFSNWYKAWVPTVSSTVPDK